MPAVRTSELKSRVNRLVDSAAHSDQLLLAVHDLLSSSEGRMWASLTDRQREEVLLSFDESENPDCLINGEKIFVNL